MSESQLDVEELTKRMNKKVARVPNLFLLDTSRSMSGSRIGKVNEGLENFVSEVVDEEMAEFSIDVSMVTFGNNVTIEQDFRPISEVWRDGDDPDPPKLTANGSTPMCEAIVEGLEHLENYKKTLDSDGITRKKALVWLLTDGEPNNGPGTSEWNTAQDLIKQGTIETDDDDPHMFFFAAGVGDEAGTDRLKQLVSQGNEDLVEAFDLQEHMFAELFEVASDSAKGSATGGGGETTEDVLPDDVGESDDSSGSGQV